MGIFKRLFSREEKVKTPQASVDTIHPTQFRKEEFSFEAFHDISVAQAAEKVASGEVQVLDVRFEYEYRDHHIPEATLIPLPKLPSHFEKLDPAKPTLVVCEHGMRSIQACSFLSARGFKTLYNMVGGMSVYPGKQEGMGIQG